MTMMKTEDGESKDRESRFALPFLIVHSLTVSVLSVSIVDCHVLGTKARDHRVSLRFKKIIKVPLHYQLKVL